MARLQIHPIGLAVVIFGLLTFIIALGGLGAATYSCQATDSYQFCAKNYQWEWWSIWFEFSLLLSLFVTCFLEQAFKRGRIVLLAFFVLATQCIMWSAHNFITEIQLGPINVRDVAQDAVNAASAGFVLLGLTNFAVIIVLGKDFGYEGPAGGGYAQQGLGGGGAGAGIGAGMQFQSSAPV